jgi:hypothetical protein
MDTLRRSDSKELITGKTRQIEDANMAEAAVKLKQIQTALQAAILRGICFQCQLIHIPDRPARIGFAFVLRN